MKHQSLNKKESEFQNIEEIIQNFSEYYSILKFVHKPVDNCDFLLSENFREERKPQELRELLLQVCENKLISSKFQEEELIEHEVAEEETILNFGKNQNQNMDLKGTSNDFEAIQNGKKNEKKNYADYFQKGKNKIQPQCCCWSWENKS